MKFILLSLLLISFNASANYFVEVDALNPLLYAVDASHSLRTDIHVGKKIDEFDVSIRYANETAVTSDTDGSGVKGDDGHAHHFGLRGAFHARENVRIGLGYVYSLFSADLKFNDQKTTLNQNISGFELFASYQWDFTQYFIRSEVDYHHIFGNINKVRNGKMAEYDIGQGKLSVLIGYQF